MFYTCNPKASLTVWFARKLLQSAFKLEFDRFFYKQVLSANFAKD